MMTAMVLLAALLPLAARAPATAAYGAVSEAMAIRILQRNIDQAFLWHFLHKNGRNVSPAPGKIRSIGVKLIRATGRSFSESYHFYVFNSTAVNAMTSPGGNVFVFQGLLDMGLTDAQTAGVIAHEIGHVVNRHWLSRLERSIDAKVKARYAAKVYGKNSAEIAYLYSVLQNLAYDRQEEYQADFTGMQLMVDSGYPARGLVELLQKTYETAQEAARTDLRAAARLAGSNPYLLNHPLMPERIQKDAAFADSPMLKPRKKRLF